MYFNEVSPQAENLLEDIIELKNKKLNESEYWNDRFDNLDFDEEVIFRSLFKELRESDLINVTWADNIPYMLNITNKGKTYFEMKERYEQEMEKQRSIVINAGDGSPINMNIGSGNATQNVNYANNEQLKALQDFVSMIKCSDELTVEQKKEVLELIEGIAENQKSGKKTIIKSLLSCVTPIVSVAKTLKDSWETIVSLFS